MHVQSPAIQCINACNEHLAFSLYCNITLTIIVGASQAAPVTHAMVRQQTSINTMSPSVCRPFTYIFSFHEIEMHCTLMSTAAHYIMLLQNYYYCLLTEIPNPIYISSHYEDELRCHVASSPRIWRCIMSQNDG